MCDCDKTVYTVSAAFDRVIDLCHRIDEMRCDRKTPDITTYDAIQGEVKALADDYAEADAVRADVIKNSGEAGFAMAVRDLKSKGRGLNFSIALWYLKRGDFVSRHGWSENVMWVAMASPSKVSDDEICAEFEADIKRSRQLPDGEHWKSTAAPTTAPFLAIATADCTITPWVPTQADMLADDWMIVEP